MSNILEMYKKDEFLSEHIITYWDSNSNSYQVVLYSDYKKIPEENPYKYYT